MVMNFVGFVEQHNTLFGVVPWWNTSRGAKETSYPSCIGNFELIHTCISDVGFNVLWIQLIELHEIIRFKVYSNWSHWVNLSRTYKHSKFKVTAHGNIYAGGYSPIPSVDYLWVNEIEPAGMQDSAQPINNILALRTHCSSCFFLRSFTCQQLNHPAFTTRCTYHKRSPPIKGTFTSP